MKFTGTWMELESTILSEVTQTQKNTQYVLTDKWILGKERGTPTIHLMDHMKFKRKEDQRVMPQSYLEGGTK